MRWLKTARPQQLSPPGNWRLWLILAGRGFGKTRTGAEDIAHFALWHEGVRCAVVAPTYAAARDVCVEGESGLLSVIPQICLKSWNRSLGELRLINGSRIKLYSADRPDILRGPQHHRAWGDELASWRAPEALDHLLFGLRLGEKPQCILTTTPRPLPWLRDLVARAGQDVHLTRGSTFDNAAHLPASMLNQLRLRYAGSQLGRQELYAEILQGMPGMLWPQTVLQNIARIDAAKLEHPISRIVIGLDPALRSHAGACETGIIAAALLADGHYVVLADASGRLTPDGWASRVAELWAYWQKRCAQISILVEANAGGDLLAQILRRVQPLLPLKLERATAGKSLRAMPVASLYAQALVKHAGLFAALEDQMSRMSERGLMPSSDPDVSASPDRVDALVWALSELMHAPIVRPQIRSLT